MAQKHFSMLISVLISIAIMMTCAKTSESVITQSSMVMQTPVSKTRPIFSKLLQKDFGQVQTAGSETSNLTDTSNMPAF